MTTEATNSPAFMLYRVDGNGSEARWTRIGAAWPNKDGVVEYFADVYSRDERVLKALEKTATVRTPAA